jgi:hypothetical protein
VTDHTLLQPAQQLGEQRVVVRVENLTRVENLSRGKTSAR